MTGNTQLEGSVDTSSQIQSALCQGTVPFQSKRASNKVYMR